jgi:argininosuccinate lyase
MKDAIESSHATATDLADWLVQNLQYPFRQAYQITGKIVDYAAKKNVTLEKLSIHELQKFDKKISQDVFSVLSPIQSMKSKTSYGGTSPQGVKKSIQYAIKKYL